MAGDHSELVGLPSQISALVLLQDSQLLRIECPCFSLALALGFVVDEVGEREEVDIVEDTIEIIQKHDDVGERGVGRIPTSKGSLAVCGSRRLIQLLSDAGANELNPEFPSCC